jgi:hypothetical protein
VGLRSLAAGAVIAAAVPAIALGMGPASSPGSPAPRATVTPFIIAGHGAHAATWPFLASVINPEGLCTGDLVAARWVLTARHCVTRSSGAVFSPGEVRITIGVGPLLSRRSWLTPIRVVSFPGYRPATSIGDLALIELRAPTTRQTVELATVNPDPTLTVPVGIAGWGLTSDTAVSTPNTPREARTLLWPQAYCKASEPSVFDPATEICSGGPDPTHSTVYPSVCNGDSGGPMVLPGSGGVWTDRLLGITDYGSDIGCAAFPNVFQDIPAHLRWITGVTGLRAVPVLRAHQLRSGHSNATIRVLLRASQARTTIQVLSPNGTVLTSRRVQAWHRQPVLITIGGLVPGVTVRGDAVVTVNAYGTSPGIGVVLRTRPVPCVLHAGGACPAGHLAGRNLSHLNLSGIDLRAADLTRARLLGTNLTGARLAGAHLAFADLLGATLAGVDLTGVLWDTTTCPDGTVSSANGTSPQSCIGH